MFKKSAYMKNRKRKPWCIIVKNAILLIIKKIMIFFITFFIFYE
nr:MAG TPA_asm: protein of unknown function (DUF4711) [Caudoviricetes sp.]